MRAKLAHLMRRFVASTAAAAVLLTGHFAAAAPIVVQKGSLSGYVYIPSASVKAAAPAGGTNGAPVRVTTLTTGSGTFTPLAPNTLARITLVGGGGGGAAAGGGGGGGSGGMAGPFSWGGGGGGSGGSAPGSAGQLVQVVIRIVGATDYLIGEGGAAVNGPGAAAGVSGRGAFHASGAVSGDGGLTANTVSAQEGQATRFGGLIAYPGRGGLTSGGTGGRGDNVTAGSGGNAQTYHNSLAHGANLEMRGVMAVGVLGTALIGYAGTNGASGSSNSSYSGGTGGPARGPTFGGKSALSVKYAGATTGYGDGGDGGVSGAGGNGGGIIAGGTVTAPTVGRAAAGSTPGQRGVIIIEEFAP